MTFAESRFSDSRTIFNAVADAYDAYRPRYPAESILFLVTLGDLDRTSTIADIGTGTGRLAIALAPYVRLVYAVDTAQAMLDRLMENAAQVHLTNIRPIEAPGEQTKLPANSLDLVVLSQSFHWMQKEAALKEAGRLLKENQPLVILWNRVLESNEQYHQVLQNLIKTYNPDYKGGEEIPSSDFVDLIRKSGLFSEPEYYTFPASQEYRASDYIGYLLSKSYVGASLSPHQVNDFMRSAFDIVLETTKDGKVVEHFETILLVARRK